MTEETKLSAALDLARAGFAIFPLTPDTKTPAISNWQNLATTHEDTIARWWAEWPQANIGLPTLNHIVIDIDPRNGGRDTFEALALCEEFPKTARAQTQSGGDHIYYALPPHTVVKGGTNKLGPGVDIKSWGGYVVAPGSSIGGRAYAWGNDRPVALAPAWLIERCKANKPRSNEAGKRIIKEDAQAIAMAQAWLDKHAPEAHLGAIDDTAFKVAARLYDFGVALETATELLTEWSETRAFPPMQAERIATIAESASRNRDNAIGSRHPSASGFTAVEITERAGPVAPAQDEDCLESYSDAAGKALSESGDPLVTGIIDRGTFSTWYGPPKSGKTFVVLDLCLHIAAGAPWVGRKTRRGTVVYVAAEGGRGIYKRLRALQLQRPELDGRTLFVIRKTLDLLHGTEHLAFLAKQVALASQRAGMPVELIVIDTIARALGGGDENSPSDMGLLVKNLDLLRERTGAHVLGIHHTGKDAGKGMRGHSSLLGAVDTEIQILDNGITSPNQRDLDDDLRLRFGLRAVSIGMDGGGNYVSSCIVDIREDGGAASEQLPLQGRLSDFLDEIDEAQSDNLEKPFGWQLAASCLSKIRFRQSSDKPVERTTVLTMLSELSEKGWVRKSGRNQWTRVCRKLSEDVGN